MNPNNNNVRIQIKKKKTLSLIPWLTGKTGEKLTSEYR